MPHARSPIGRLYNERVAEYKNSHKWVEKDLTTTWEKSFRFVQQNPPMGEARRLLPEWVLFAWDVVLKSDYRSTTKTRLIACIFAIANIGYSASTLNPVIGENRLEAISGISRKSLWLYKKILHNLGLVTISYEETPNSDKHYGTMFRIQVSSVSFTDISSLLITTMGNRDITSVKRVNDLELKHQITELIKTWQPHALWLSVLSGKVKGHLVWTVLRQFPNLQLEQICQLFGWSSRTARNVLLQLQQSSLIYWDEDEGMWVCYEEDQHWQDLVTMSV